MKIAPQHRGKEGLAVCPVMEKKGVDAVEDQGPDIEERQHMPGPFELLPKIQLFPAQKQQAADHEKQQHRGAEKHAQEIIKGPDRGGRVKIPEQHPGVPQHHHHAGQDPAYVKIRFSHALASSAENFTIIRSFFFCTDPSQG